MLIAHIAASIIASLFEPNALITTISEDDTVNSARGGYPILKRFISPEQAALKHTTGSTSESPSSMSIDPSSLTRLTTSAVIGTSGFGDGAYGFHAHLAIPFSSFVLGFGGRGQRFFYDPLGPAFSNLSFLGSIAIAGFLQSNSHNRYSSLFAQSQKDIGIGASISYFGDSLENEYAQGTVGNLSFTIPIISIIRIGLSINTIGIAFTADGNQHFLKPKLSTTIAYVAGSNRIRIGTAFSYDFSDLRPGMDIDLGINISLIKIEREIQNREEIVGSEIDFLLSALSDDDDYNDEDDDDDKQEIQSKPLITLEPLPYFEWSTQAGLSFINLDIAFASKWQWSSFYLSIGLNAALKSVVKTDIEWFMSIGGSFS